MHAAADVVYRGLSTLTIVSAAHRRSRSWTVHAAAAADRVHARRALEFDRDQEVRDPVLQNANDYVYMDL